MQSAIVVGYQVTIMFLLTLVGVYCCRKGIITQEVARYLSNFLLNVALPGVVFSSLYQPMKTELLTGFFLAFFLAVGMHLFGIAIARLLIPKREGQYYHSERFSIIFANSAFMAIPLIRASLGEESTFFASAFIAVFVLFQWTYGILELGGHFEMKKLVINPCVIAALSGFLIFLIQIKIPGPIIDTVRLLGGLTTPLSMVVAGVFLARLKVSELKSCNMYWAALLRTMIVPLCCVAIVWAIGAPSWFTGALPACLAAIYCYSCPSGVSVVLLSATLGKDETYPGRLIAVTTLMSLVTLPAIAALANAVLV